MRDDYGDGELSRPFFEHAIPPEQQKAASDLRALIAKDVGPYSAYKKAAEQGGVKGLYSDRALRLGSRALQLQWVTGDAKKAEDSFFKINQEAAPIEPTELMILKSRRKGNAMAARAILRAGTGHKYWSGFPEPRQVEIQAIGTEIYEALFKPPLNTPIKTLDVPVGGRGYSADALPLVFDLVNVTNNVRMPTKPKPNQDTPLKADLGGDETIACLKRTREVVRRISGLHPSSLGLHPALYFYSKSGRYQPTSLLAVVSLMMDLEKQDRFKEFTQHRRSFEDFLMAYRTFPNQVAQKFGSGIKGYDRLKQVYVAILDNIRSGETAAETFEALRQDDRIGVLAAMVVEDERRPRKDFDSETKSAVFLREALETPIRCRLCQGLIHYNSITIDHIVRKQDGGLGVVDNGQVAHPYCNSTVKN